MSTPDANPTPDLPTRGPASGFTSEPTRADPPHAATAGFGRDADAIVVGARCAGSAAAIAMARAGRRVIALDAVRFPSTTVSTHLLFAGGVAELSRLGALDRVEALGAPHHDDAYIELPDGRARGTYSPVDGIAYGMCVRRSGLDQALVDTARAAGAEVREGARVTGLVWSGDRVTGVHVQERGAASYTLRAPLVVGADGRRSLIAREVGAGKPHTTNVNQRACYYAYYDDPRTEWRGTAAMWRTGRELGTAFPCDGGLTLVLLMPPRERADAFRLGLEGEYDRTLTLLPGLADRLAGCTRTTKIVQATDLPSYFRHSTGPGWALAGDAGHFKDPVTAQGIRDALRFGRLLGEAVAPVLDTPTRLDAATASWEHRRDHECRETYHWTNTLARSTAVSPLEETLMRSMATRPEGSRPLLDVYSRIRKPSELMTPRVLATLLARTLTHPGVDRTAVLRTALTEARSRLATHRSLRRR
ncbi:FAD-dependent monooxygenase [Embleya sp. NPDC005971]|uniref:NAD(P)/FAD-dependent oxidoreductase n=1 Tax=Embleya sp. NPDC005971 TaxID=3156724 RepID=UPI00340A39E3